MLESLTKDLGGRIRPCEHLNPNAREWARHELRTRIHGYRLTVFLSKSLIQFDVGGFDTPVSFSANKPDRVCLLNRPIGTMVPGLSCPVFVGSFCTEATVTWLQEYALLVSNLLLGPKESLQVYQNGLVLVGRHERANVETILRLCDLADRLRAPINPLLVDGLPFNLENVPVELRHLEPLIRRFAVGDDILRSEIIAEASQADRRRLRRQVVPLLSKINEFLDSFGDRTYSPEAILISHLAEAASELGARERTP